MMFLDCPAYLDTGRTVRCGLPAEVRCRFTLCSTDGPLESAMIRCPAGHGFNGPIASLTLEAGDSRDPGTAGAAAKTGHTAGHASDNRADVNRAARPDPVMTGEPGAAGLRWLWELAAPKPAGEGIRQTHATNWRNRLLPHGGRHMRASLALRTADERCERGTPPSTQ